jgi:type VI secretion system secreted protein VgrG
MERSVGIFAFVSSRTSRHRPARRGASLGIRIGTPVVALLGAILLAPTALAAPTAISLGTAAQFAILAGDSITNVPTSVILGDVGVTPDTGAGMGLTCDEVTGTIYTVDLAGPLCRDVDPGLLTTAKNAVTTAYNSAAALTPDSTFAGADNQLGTQNLVAGVYRFTAASTANLIGNLTLTGSSADVWVFQATSTLVTAANSSISFSGGAQACNVFWQVGSAATLGANSDFAGTILAHDDISLGDSVTVDGRLLAGGQANHAGAVTLISDTITRSDCATVAPSPSPTTAGPGPTATRGTTPGGVPTQATTDTASPGAPARDAAGSLGLILLVMALAVSMVAFKAPKRTIR